MRNTLVLALTLLLVLQPLSAEQWTSPRPEPQTRRGKLWKLSALMVAAATTVDATSSWGRYEANPLLRSSNGRFGMQGIGLKAMILGGTLSAQYLLLRKNPKAEKYGTLTNMVFAGVLTGAAVSNFQRAARTRNASPTPTTNVQNP